MLLLSMMLGMFSTSCQDMLAPDSERHAYTVAEDTLYSYWGILKSLQNIAERYVILNECRGDLVDETSFVSDTIAAIVNFGDVRNPEFWKDGACAYLKISDYYHIINSCNAYIAMCDTVRTTGTNSKYMIKEYAQVQAIRAWVYMQLLYAYGENRVPFYKEPMLTTDDINNFMDNDSHPLLTAELLAKELGPDLEEMEPIEVNLGLPQFEGMPNYNNYGDVSSGNSHFVCHSSKCMFPVSLVLGDLYLLSANSTDDRETYKKAAQHYYNYINTEKCGPLPVDKCFSRGLLDDKLDYPIYTYDTNDIPYNDKTSVSRTAESITCIPSNKGKLEGKVLTDINRLFGFEAEMRTDTWVSEDGDDGGSSASVRLNRKYERELIPSKGYEALCDSQKYEIYVGTTSGGTFRYESLEILPDVGDARRAWIYASLGQQYNFRVGDDILYGKMVSKQNPSSNFSTTYPVIYRKSTVWLRFAEALNRAGFPSYAFAILKTGLCNNQDEWFPTDPSRANLNDDGTYMPVTDRELNYVSELYENGYDYPIKATDTLFFYKDVKDGVTVKLPQGWKGEEKMSTHAELEEWLTAYFEAEFEEYQEKYDAYQEEYLASLQTDNPLEPMEPMESPRTIDKSQVFYTVASENSFENQPKEDCVKACYYLDRREVAKAGNTPFLNFQQPNLNGLSTQQVVYVKEQGKLFDLSSSTQREPSDANASRTFTIGVHQRGCGFVLYNDPAEYGRSSYNYVGMVAKKIKEVHGKELTAEDIYSGKYDAWVQDAVEDLIIDECALELAFEGSRFSDLCRVAMRRHDNNYLAERIAKRHTGKIDESVRSRLMNQKNWFLPIPEE